MASLTVYPVTSGSSTYVEYVGSAGDVVIFNADVTGYEKGDLRHMKLGLIRNVGLNTLRDNLFATGALQVIQLIRPMALQANSNGVIIFVLPTQGLTAGLTVTVTGEVYA